MDLPLHLRQFIALAGLIAAGSGLFYVYKPERRVLVWAWLWLGITAAAFVGSDPLLVAALAASIGIAAARKRRPEIALVSSVPPEPMRERLNTAIFDELCQGVFEDRTTSLFLQPRGASRPSVLRT